MIFLSALLSCQPAVALHLLLLMQWKFKGNGCLAVKEGTKQLLKHSVIYDEKGFFR